MSHIGEAKDIREIHTFTMTASGQSVLERIKLQSSTIGLDVDGLRCLHPERSWAWESFRSSSQALSVEYNAARVDNSF